VPGLTFQLNPAKTGEISVQRPKKLGQTIFMIQKLQNHIPPALCMIQVIVLGRESESSGHDPHAMI